MSWKNHVDVLEFETKLPVSGKSVNFKGITMGKLKNIAAVVTSNDEESVQNALDNLITKCVISDDFEITNLYSIDRLHLLLEMRIASKGPTYQVTFNCSNCKNQFIKNFNVSKDFKIKRNKKEFPEELKLNDKIKIKIRPQKRKDQIEANLVLKKIKESIEDNIELTHNERIEKLNEFNKLFEIKLGTLVLANSIKSIISPDGEENDLSIDEREEFLDTLKEEQYEILDNWIKKNSFGIDTKLKIVCPHCKDEKELEVPIDDFFV